MCGYVTLARPIRFYSQNFWPWTCERHEFIITEVQKLWGIRSHAGSLDSFCTPCKGPHVKSGIWAEISLAFADQILGPGITELHPRKRSAFFFSQRYLLLTKLRNWETASTQRSAFPNLQKHAIQASQGPEAMYPTMGRNLICSKREWRECTERGRGRRHKSQLQLCPCFQLSLGHSCSLIFFQAI